MSNQAPILQNVLDSGSAYSENIEPMPCGEKKASFEAFNANWKASASILKYNFISHSFESVCRMNYTSHLH